MSSAAKFFQVIQARDTAAVKRMLSAEPELVSARNEKGQSALLLTAYSGNKELCDVLQAQGIPLELHEAAALGRLDRVKQLIEEMPSEAKTYSPDGFPVIALAAVFGHLEVAEYLFEKGADLNAAATNGTGYNALTGAVASGHTAVVSWPGQWRGPELPLRKWLLPASYCCRERPPGNREYPAGERRRFAGPDQ
jgi:uncharacterized protein